MTLLPSIGDAIILRAKLARIQGHLEGSASVLDKVDKVNIQGLVDGLKEDARMLAEILAQEDA
jgi:hypothetical protein